MEQWLLKQKEFCLNCICIQMGDINSRAFPERACQEWGPRAGGAAAFLPQESGQDEKRGLGVNPHSRSVSNSISDAPGGTRPRAECAPRKGARELIMGYRSSGPEEGREC